MFGRSPSWPEPHRTRRVDPRLRAGSAMEQAATYIRELELANSRLEARLAARPPEVDPDELAAREHEVAALRREIARRDDELDELRDGLGARDRDLAELREELAASEREHALGQHDLDARAEERARQEEARAGHDQQRQYEIRLAEASEEIESVKVRVGRESARELEHKKRAFLCQFLEVLDDLDRAIIAARADRHQSAIVEGIELVHRHFLAKLDEHAVALRPALGKRFDPGHHQALSTVMVDDPERDGLVAAVIREGYAIGDEVLRPASVVVNKLRAQD